MNRFSPDRPIFAIVCILAVVSALVSGAIYPYYAMAFTIAVTLCLFLSMAGRAGYALGAVWPAWVLLGVTYISSFWTVSLNLTFSQAFYLSAMVSFSYLAAFSVAEDRKYTLLRLLAGAAAAVSVYGIYQYYAGFAHTEDYLKAYGASGLGLPNIGVSSALLVLESRRAFSTMLSPNVLACFLAMVFPAGLAVYGAARTAPGRLLAASALVLMLGAAILTKSVGGLIAFAAGVAVYITISLVLHGGSSAKGTFFWIAAAVIVVVFAGYFVAYERAGSGFLGVGSSFADRLGYYTGSLEIIGGRPSLGNGAGSFQVEYFSTIKPGAGETRYAHNLPLQTMAETGALGLLSLAVLFWVFFARCIRGIRRDEGMAPVYAALASGGAAFLAHNMVDYTWYVHETAVVWWLYFGLAAAGDTRAVKFEKPMKAAAAAIALVFSVCYMKAGIAERYKDDALRVLGEAGIATASAARSGPVPGEAVRLAGMAAAVKPYDDNYRAFLANLYEGAAYNAGPMSARLAVEQYEEAIRLNPLYPYHYRDLGILYMKLGDKEAARRMFEEARRRYPAGRRLAGQLREAEK
jgi:O-antigen ligase